MQVERRPASNCIRSVVRSFSERRASFAERSVTTPLPARPDQFIEIYLADRYGVSHDEGPVELAPEIVVVGPQSYRRARLFLSGNIHVFTMRFQPAGFNALFGIAMTALADEGAAACDVIGASGTALRDAILQSASFAARVAAAEQWVADRLALARPVDAVARSALMLSRAQGQVRIDALAARTGLGKRQFTRRFTTQVGLAPKLFARTLRFNNVLDAKAASPAAAWTDLVHRAGYADQAHFIRECRALAGDTPTGFLAEWAEHGA